MIGAGPVQRVGRGGGAAGAPAGQAAGGGRGAIPTADFTTTERLDHVLPPSATGDDAFFEFLFSHAPVKYADLKKKAEAREPLPAFRLDGVTLTFDINNDYEIVRTQLTQNVVGLVEGTDPQLKSDLRRLRRALRPRRLRGRRARQRSRRDRAETAHPAS